MPRPDGRQAAARSLAIDAVTAQIVQALRQADVEPILLKGPAVADLLYAGSDRAYTDADLLVSEDALPRAEAVLGEHGFQRLPVAVEPTIGLPHAAPWVRRDDGAEVDLHRSLAGVGVAPSELWRALEPLTRRALVARTEVRALDAVAQAFVVTLHAGQHGPEAAKPIEDLRRAIDQLDEGVWRESAALAERVAADISFAHGLRLANGGDELARRLGLAPAGLVEAARDPRAATRLALAFERLATTPGAVGKVRFVARELVPPPPRMRWLTPLARRGRLGLGAAYVVRAAALLRDAPASVVSWHRHSFRRRSK
jgi:hypothetical protein